MYGDGDGDSGDSYDGDDDGDDGGDDSCQLNNCSCGVIDLHHRQTIVECTYLFACMSARPPSPIGKLILC